MAFDVRKIANATLDAADDCGYAITNMALNKLVFFAHGWHLALHDEPLVDSPFEAWQYGPVHPLLYRQFKAFGDRPISERATRVDLASGRQIAITDSLPTAISDHIRRNAAFYGRLPAERLSQISHEEGAPWDQVWSGLGSQPGMTIGNCITRDYYQKKLGRPT